MYMQFCLISSTSNTFVIPTQVSSILSYIIMHIYYLL